MRIEHKFKEHVIHPGTKRLIVGTFNPGQPGNDAEYFYGRSSSLFWSLLPNALGVETSLPRSVEAWKAFHLLHHIDFMDMIAALDNVPERVGLAYKDEIVDRYAISCFCVGSLIDRHPDIMQVFFTRSTFDRKVIPVIHGVAMDISKRTKARGGHCYGLLSPADYDAPWTKRRPAQWRKALTGQLSPLELH